MCYDERQNYLQFLYNADRMSSRYPELGNSFTSFTEETLPKFPFKQNQEPHSTATPAHSHGLRVGFAPILPSAEDGPPDPPRFSAGAVRCQGRLTRKPRGPVPTVPQPRDPARARVSPKLSVTRESPQLGRAHATLKTRQRTHQGAGHPVR